MTTKTGSRAYDLYPERNDAPVPNPGNARWCLVHRRLECTKQKRRDRGDCHQLAVRGLSACRNHAGLSLPVAKAKGEAVITAWQVTGVATINPGEAVLGVLQMSWIRLNAYSRLLRGQVETEGTQADDPAQEDVPEASGLIGFRYGAAGKDGRVFVQSEEIRALVTLEAAERDRVVRYAKTAHDMGIADKIIKLTERWAETVSARVTDMLMHPSLALTPAQFAAVPQLITMYLSTIDVDAPSAVLVPAALAIEGTTVEGDEPE